MTPQRAADRLAEWLDGDEGHIYDLFGLWVQGKRTTAQTVSRLLESPDTTALAEAIELGLLLLSDDGPAAVAQAWVKVWDQPDGVAAVQFIAVLTAKLRERA